MPGLKENGVTQLKQEEKKGKELEDTGGPQFFRTIFAIDSSVRFS